MDFDDIFRKYYEQILNFCYLKISDKQLAEDCTQEVFLAFSKKMYSLKPDTNVIALLQNVLNIMFTQDVLHEKCEKIVNLIK